jgi:hypothetical protein
MTDNTNDLMLDERLLKVLEQVMSLVADQRHARIELMGCARALHDAQARVGELADTVTALKKSEEMFRAELFLLGGESESLKRDNNALRARTKRGRPRKKG